MIDKPIVASVPIPIYIYIYINLWCMFLKLLEHLLSGVSSSGKNFYSFQFFTVLIQTIQKHLFPISHFFIQKSSELSPPEHIIVALYT